jgi:hypothetical protein
MNFRETTVREIFKPQKSGDKLEAKKRRQKQQRTNKNRKKNWSSNYLIRMLHVTRFHDRKVSTITNLTNPFNDLKMHRGVTIRTTIHVLL